MATQRFEHPRWRNWSSTPVFTVQPELEAIYKAAGWKGKIPKDFEGTIVLDGVLFEVVKHVPRGRKTSKHRIFYHCDCGKRVSFGRMRQHLPACGCDVRVGERR